MPGESHGWRSLVGYSPWGRKESDTTEQLHLHPHQGFPGASDSKESACNAGDLGSIPGLGRSPGARHDNPLQYSCLENPRGQRSLATYSPWGCKELNTTERLSTAQHTTESTIVLGNTRCTFMKNAKAIQNNKMCVRARVCVCVCVTEASGPW